MTSSFTLFSASAFVEGEMRGDREYEITEALPFDTAHAKAVTFARDAAVIRRVDDSEAGIVLVPVGAAVARDRVIFVKNPHLAFIRLQKALLKEKKPLAGVHESAVVADGAEVAADAFVGPLSVVSKGAVIKSRAHVSGRVFIGENAVVGKDSRLLPGVVILDRVVIGQRVLIGAGSVIGGDGFGYVLSEDGAEKIPHLGTVVIEDDVEIGSLNAIDRATFGETRIGRKVKTDNLVQLAHNVSVGPGALIVAQAGIGGSVTIGKGAIIAGQAGVAQHIRIGDFARIGPQAGVERDVEPGTDLLGSPAVPFKLFARINAVLKKLPEMKKDINRLKQLLEKRGKD